MIRAIVWLLVSLLVITFIRGVVGILARGAGELFEPAKPPAGRNAQQPSKGGFGGELVKDPVCGTFVSPAAAMKKTTKGETHYFCSAECRDKFA
jgi:YHS domain-containing protein